MISYYFKSLSRLNLEEVYIATSSMVACVMQSWGLRSHLSCEKAGTLNPKMQCFSLWRPGDHLQENCYLGSVMIFPHKHSKKQSQQGEAISLPL